jgi:nucleotidyltransferase/DNA polymerase involved in DNA repair
MLIWSECEEKNHNLWAFFYSHWIYEVCRGIDHEPVSARQLPKSIGCSKNFPGKTCLDTKEKVFCIHSFIIHICYYI